MRLTTRQQQMARAAAGLALCLGCTAVSPSPTPATPVPSPGHRVVELANDGPGGIHRPAIVVQIVDASGHLVAARAETNADAASVELSGAERIYVRSLRQDDTVVYAAWYGTICDRTATLTISADLRSILVAEGPREPCDLAAVRRGVVLTFDRPVDAALPKPELRTFQPAGG